MASDALPLENIGKIVKKYGFIENLHFNHEHDRVICGKNQGRYVDILPEGKQFLENAVKLSDRRVRVKARRALIRPFRQTSIRSFLNKKRISYSEKEFEALLKLSCSNELDERFKSLQLLCGAKEKRLRYFAMNEFIREAELAEQLLANWCCPSFFKECRSIYYGDEDGDNYQSDGNHSDGNHSDGNHSDGNHSDGNHSDGNHSDGEYSDGEYSDGDHSEDELLKRYSCTE